MHTLVKTKGTKRDVCRDGANRFGARSIQMGR
jgi:hypothetical protein